MRVLIVAKTRQGGRACIGGVTTEGKSVRLMAADRAYNNHTNSDYNVGDVWEIEGEPAAKLIPPHVENIDVCYKKFLYRHDDPVQIIRRFFQPIEGSPLALYDGFLQSNPNGSLYIAERTGIPSASTCFWRPDHPLQRNEDGKRIRYRYLAENGSTENRSTGNGFYSLVFVGFQPPLPVIPAGSLLRVSLAHWWRLNETGEPGEPAGLPTIENEARCYVQLSGWFLDEPATLLPADPPPVTHTSVLPTRLPTLSTNINAPVPMDLPDPCTLLNRLKEVFGYDEFRPNQIEIIRNVLAGRDTLAIMPTGGGKSLCYQLPALLLDGLTVVVSPLISLMYDQVRQLHALGIEAAYLNSSLTYQDDLNVRQRVKQGLVKLLYLSPETLLRPETLLLLQQSRLAMLAIDEAHCISEWGHDFRPEYRQLVTVRQQFPNTVAIALTATATPQVQNDIKTTLSLRQENTFITSFDRPNLFLAAQPRGDRLQQILDFLNTQRNQSGILYCSTQKLVDELTAQLQQHNISALPYHAGLTDLLRQHNQNAFIHDDVRVMVATVAFGMGINKPDVRFVLHADLPKDIENYYQQIGRAGRDGLRADCLLLYSRSDVHTIQHFIQNGAESEERGRSLRLQALVRWAESNLCRRKQLLAYFGEEEQPLRTGSVSDRPMAYQPDRPLADVSASSRRAARGSVCKMCDNCLREGQELADMSELARKFLTCVAQLREKFGVNQTILVLRGSQAKDVLAWRQDKLAAYNSGKEFSNEQWKHVAHQLILQGALTQNIEVGNLQLSEQGRAILAGQTFSAVPFEVKTLAVQAPSEVPVYDATLFELLRAKRKEVADAANLPPYVIFHDRSLFEMATYFPHSAASFAKLYGIGGAKVERYADIFLPIIRDYCAAHQQSERTRIERTISSHPTLLIGGSNSSIMSNKPRSRMEEISLLFAAGKNISDLIEMFHIKRSTILSHLSSYSQAGGKLPVARLRAESQLSMDEQEKVMTGFKELGTKGLGLVFALLDGKVSYDELHLLRAVYLLENTA